MRVTDIEAFDLGDDVLLVTGLIDGQEVRAQGWVSALSNYHPPANYRKVSEREASKEDSPYPSAGLHLKLDAKPREMSKAKRRAYCRDLLIEAHRASLPPEQAEPTRIEV